LHAAGTELFVRDAASLSSPQKLESATFHVPFSRTAVPVDGIDWPAAIRLYFTAAFVAEVRVTPVTFAETFAASGLLLKDEMALLKTCPFCSSAAFSLSGVAEEKNFSQLAVICAAAPELVPVLPEPLPVALAVDAGVVAAGAEVAADEELLELLGLELLEHAVAVNTATIAPATATPFAR
jgi:hypothetical protein